MIKRSGAILLTLLYTATVMGFALNLHYCGNYIASVKINAPAKQCGMGHAFEMKCCKDKHVVVKVKDAHQGQSFSFLAKTLVSPAANIYLSELGFAVQQAAVVKHAERGPPHPPFNSDITFIKNMVFRI